MKSKILALHGMSQDAEIFRTRLGRLPHKAKGIASFHFVSAPHLLPVKEGDDVAMRSWYVRDKSSGSIDMKSLDVSLGFLEDVWREQGPFDGVLGFSMGGTLAALLACYPARFPGLSVLVVGGARDLPSSLLDELQLPHTIFPLNIPSLHIFGQADQVVPPSSSSDLSSKFINPVVIHHEQGHCIPSKAAMLNQYVEFLQNALSPLNHCPKAPGREQELGKMCKPSDSHQSSIVRCLSDDIAAQQREELEAIESIFASDITFLQQPPAAGGDPCASFVVTLSCAADVDGLPSRWVGNLTLKFELPESYPEEGRPLMGVSTGKLGMDEFSSAHRKSLTQAVQRRLEEATYNGGGMVLLDAIQAGNDWLAEGGWRDCRASRQNEDQKGSDEVVSEGDEEAKEMEWIQSATREASTAAAALTLSETEVVAEGEESFVPTSGGLWRYTVGLVGKPSAGKSTLFNAATRAMLDDRGGRKMAEVAPHPFTTIDPNIGSGWYLSPQVDSLPEAAGGPSARGGAFGRADAAGKHGRYLPVVIKDVAGLVPGAYKGRGKGNKFLGDLCDADVLIHVVDSTGKADRDGNIIVQGVLSAEPRSSPMDDVAWVREELHRWIFGNISAKWDSVVRRGEGSRCFDRVLSLFSGYQGHSPRRLVQVAARRARLDLDKAVHFSGYDMHRLVAHYLSVRFPTCVALNKMDELGTDGEGIVEQCQREAADRGEVAVPVSARAECYALQRNAITSEEEALLNTTLARWGSTGVLDALSEAVKLNPPVLCYPVSDLDSEMPIWHSGNPNQSPNPQSSLSLRLHDCLQLKPQTTVHEVFEALKRNAIPQVTLHGDFVRAEGKPIDPSAKRRQLRRDQIIDETNCVLRIYSNKKHTWQKDYNPSTIQIPCADESSP